MDFIIKLLKLSVTYHENLGSDEILFIHLGHCITHGKVSYSTDIAVAEKPDYVLLVLGNVDNICYLCHVADYAYRKDPISGDQLKPDFLQYSLNRFREESRRTWFIFDSMQKIPTDFVEQLLPESADGFDGLVSTFIKSRANQKTI